MSSQNPVLALQICGLEGTDGLPGTPLAPGKMAGPSPGTQGLGLSEYMETMTSVNMTVLCSSRLHLSTSSLSLFRPAPSPSRAHVVDRTLSHLAPKDKRPFSQLKSAALAPPPDLIAPVCA